MTQHGVSPVFEGSDVVSTIGGNRDEAAEFLLSCDARVQARFRRYLTRIKDGQSIKSPEAIRHLRTVSSGSLAGARVYELKVHDGPGWRLYIVKYHSRWYVTHGRKKPKDKLVPAEIEKALTIFGSV